MQLPGSVGGADWQSAAFDPDTRRCCMSTSITGPFVADLVKGDPARTDLELCARTARVSARPAGPAAAEAAVRPHHRDRSEQGRHRLDDAERRRSARSSAAEAAESSAARQPGPRRHCFATKTLLFVGEGDPVMVRAGASRLRPGMPLSIAPGRGRQEVSRVRQGDRRDRLGDGTARRHDRRADDLHVRRQAVHRRRHRAAPTRRPDDIALSLP